MIKDFKSGEQIIRYFVLRKKEIKLKARSSEFYLNLELIDASGRIFGTLWNDALKVAEEINAGDILKIKAAVIDYHGKRHLSIDKLRRTTDADNYDTKELLPHVEKDINKLLKELDSLILSVKDKSLKALLESVFHDKSLRKEFAAAPGGKLWHHGYIGGLLEHTLSVTGIALDAASRYEGIKRDLLLAAGLLHDLGKIKTYDYKTLIDFTDEGRLLGHIVMGAQMVADKIKKIDDFPRQIEKELLHLILSHQGKLEQASPVVPMTLEGLLLYFADEMDSKANAFQRIKKQEGSKAWSSYVQLMNQYFYFGPGDDKTASS